MAQPSGGESYLMPSEKKGAAHDDLVNDLLGKQIAIIESLK
jgi:hypothetical protein